METTCRAESKSPTLLNKWFPTRMTLPLEDSQGGGVMSIQWVEASKAAKWPTAHGTVPGDKGLSAPKCQQCSLW